MADILLTGRSTTSIQSVGENWVYKLSSVDLKSRLAILGDMIMSELNAKTLKLLESGLVVYKSL